MRVDVEDAVAVVVRHLRIEIVIVPMIVIVMVVPVRVHDPVGMRVFVQMGRRGGVVVVVHGRMFGEEMRHPT
jgi:hypothetical protein